MLLYSLMLTRNCLDESRQVYAKGRLEKGPTILCYLYISCIARSSLNLRTFSLKPNIFLHYTNFFVGKKLLNA